MIILFTNVMEEKLNRLLSSIKTYLFSIAKNRIFNRIDKDKKLYFENPVEIEPGVWLDDHLEKKEREAFIHSLIDHLGELCRSILKLYYYKRFSMESIANSMNYKNEHVVKSQKLRCITDLKAMISHRYSLDDL